MPTYVRRKVTRRYAAAGAIDINATEVFLAGSGALAMTLPNPPASPHWNGHTMSIVATVAQAHTVTVTGGFNSGGASADVATFGGAIGDSMEIEAIDGVWHVKNLRNVTLG